MRLNISETLGEQHHILIIDDHQLFLDSFSLFLQHNYNFASILVADSAENAFDLLDQNQGISLIFLDLDMPGLNGHDFIVEYEKKKRTIPIVALSSSTNIAEIKNILDLGCMGFIPKTHNGKRLSEAIKHIFEGDVYIPEEIKLKITEISQASDKIYLTKRQFEILNLLNKGFSNKQIAFQLNIVEPTVKFHVSNLFGIFDVRSRMDCVQNARELGFL